MEQLAWRYLRYVRATLADADRLAPSLDRAEAVRVDTDVLLAGTLGQQAAADLLKNARAERKSSTADDQLWPLKILVCPYVYALRPEHGRGSKQLPARVIPLVLYAKLHSDGRLQPDDQSSMPVIPRDYLEPTSCDVALGSIDDADRIYATLDAGADWNGLRVCGHELLAKVTQQDPATLTLDQYEKDPQGVCLLQKILSPALHIERLLDSVLDDDQRAYPLYQSLMTIAPDLPLKSEFESLVASALHVGQMECRYPLSISQRQALIHHLARPEEAPDILAVDGPPGTGKTTLLLSAIASMWVKAAADGAMAPLIVAMSTNNQAVVNILEAFAKVKEPDGPLAGRWLEGIGSYGQYCPSKTREDFASDRSYPVHTLKDSPAGLQHAGEAFENPEALQRAKADYLRKFAAAFPEVGEPSLQRAADFLQRRIKESIGTVHAVVDALATIAGFIDFAEVSRLACDSLAAQFDVRLRELSNRSQSAQAGFKSGKSLRQDWTRHLVSEPWWLGLLAAFGLRSRRVLRDAFFRSQASDTYEGLVGERLQPIQDREDVSAFIEQVIQDCGTRARECAEELRKLHARAEKFSTAYAVVKPWVWAEGDGRIETIQGALDLGPRFLAFKQATHYWEACYLLEVEQQLAKNNGRMNDSKNSEKLERLHRRLAKLFACTVATCFTLPARYTGWMGSDSFPLFGAIDLLIADEAGQVRPEVGVVPFVLAKRALIVGDVDQLSPIRAVPAGIDKANAKRFELVETEQELAGFPRSAVAASGGNLMRIAQKATPFSRNPGRGRGMFLSEHRRCWPEIIGICNALVYGGLLVYKRVEGPRKILPSLGYVHIPGTDRITPTKSRWNRAEAAAIAKWLRGRRAEIESAFKDDCKPFGDLVAVVTPFVAQAKIIRDALKSEFDSDPRITVGTIDALQGAEYRVVIFSPTYGLGTDPGSTRFDASLSMLNVAISRAQDAFLVFGNMHLFRPHGQHPAAIVGRFLFTGGDNELKDVPVDLLVPGHDVPPGQLIRNLDAHRAVLTEALSAARFRLVIVSPFLTSDAIRADTIGDKIRHATAKGVRVTVMSDPSFAKSKGEFDRCGEILKAAGAVVHNADGPGVHSKLILVDDSWLVVGSFNWLSASRDPKHHHARYESSLRYDGNEAFQMIRESLKDLAKFIPPTTVTS